MSVVISASPLLVRCDAGLKQVAGDQLDIARTPSGRITHDKRRGRN